VLELLFRLNVSLNFVLEIVLLFSCKVVLLMLFSVNFCMETHLIFLRIRFVLIESVDAVDHSVSLSTALLNRLPKLLCCEFDISPVISLLVSIHFPLLLNDLDLVFQELLHLLILTIICHIFPFYLDFVFSSVFVDYLAPELVLLYVTECTQDAYILRHDTMGSLCCHISGLNSFDERWIRLVRGSNLHADIFGLIKGVST